MHQSVRTGSGVGVLPAMYSFSGPTSLPQFDFGAQRTSDDLKKVTLYDRYVAVIWRVGVFSELKTMRHKLCTVVDMFSVSSWETRCLRKNRRRADDE